MINKFHVHIGVVLLLINDNKVLLLKRRNTGYMDGFYGMAGGHLEKNESLKQAMVREAYEEIGINIKEEDLKIVGVIRRGDNDDYFNFFLTTEKYKGTPSIKELDKCEELIWCDIKDLPENLMPPLKRAIQNYLNGVVFDEYNFETK